MYQVEVMAAKDWTEISQNAHIVVFGDHRSPDLDRVDYALLCTFESKPGGFITIKEMDSQTAYIQYGGVFPGFTKTLHALSGYRALLGKLKQTYKFIWTRVENTNLPMLKMALSQGFIVNGCSLVKNKLYLELIMEV